MNERQASRNVMQTKLKQPSPVSGGDVCVDVWRLEQLVWCYIAEGQLCVFSFIFTSFLSSPLSLLSKAGSHDFPPPPLLLWYSDGCCRGMLPWKPSDDWWCCPLPGSLLGELEEWVDRGVVILASRGMGGGQLGGRGLGGGSFTMNFGVFVDGKSWGGVKTDG